MQALEWGTCPCAELHIGNSTMVIGYGGQPGSQATDVRTLREFPSEAHARFLETGPLTCAEVTLLQENSGLRRNRGR